MKWFPCPHSDSESDAGLDWEAKHCDELSETVEEAVEHWVTEHGSGFLTPESGE